MPLSHRATRLDRVRVYAPGSVGNLGPGLDILGLALTGAGDEVTVERRPRPGVTLDEPGHPDLPTDPDRHACTLAARAVLQRAGALDAVGLALTLRKGLPLSGGQGGSAASAVAAAVATNALLDDPLDRRGLLEICLAVETQLAGRHADNLAPSLLGGIVLIRTLDPLDIVPLPVPDGLWVALAHPAQALRTADGRAALPATVPLATALHQAAQVGAIVAALASGDLALLGRAIDDRIAEPARAPLIGGFAEVRGAALAAGALGASISGSGPTVFALAEGQAVAEAAAEAMAGAFRAAGQPATTRVGRVDRQGARRLPVSAAQEALP